MVKSQVLTPGIIMTIVFMEWRRRNKLTQKDYKLLADAYRRFHMFAKHDNKTISNAWLGLGYGEYEKSKFFQAVGHRYPRCLGWFRLTAAGKLAVSDLNAHLPWKEEFGIHIFQL